MKEILWENYKGLPIHLYKRWQLNYPIKDWLNESYLAFVKAKENFKPEIHKTKFSTYYYYKLLEIRGKINQVIYDCSFLISLENLQDYELSIEINLEKMNFDLILEKYDIKNLFTFYIEKYKQEPRKKIIKELFLKIKKKLNNKEKIRQLMKELKEVSKTTL